jgi:hypothetical protein
MKKLDIDLENADLFDDNTNGCMDIYLARQPEGWDRAEDTLVVPFGFCGEDWHAVFIGLLHAGPDEDDLQQLRDGKFFFRFRKTKAFEKRWRQKFREATTEYPMLGRISSIYDQCLFFPDDLTELRGECLKLKSGTAQPEAVKALRRLLYACDEAATRGFSLILLGG